MHKGDLGAWWGQGARSALLMRPRWEGLRVSPVLVAWLVLVPMLVDVALGRLYVAGEAWFYAPALLFGWLWPAVAAWVSWLVVAGGDAEPDADPDATGPSGPATAAHLFAMLAAQWLVVALVSHLLNLMVLHAMEAGPLQGRLYAWAYGGTLAWSLACQLLLVWRARPARPAPLQQRRAGARWLATGLLTLCAGIPLLPQLPMYWYPAQDAQAQATRPTLQLTQAVTESQPRLLQEQLGRIAAPQPGQVNVYAITFAPYADEDVFLRESALVARVMQQRFGAEGRTLQLVNHASTAQAFPWATPTNLQRAIQRMAEVMDRERDVLFIHLTSHGAQNGELAAVMSPLQVEPVTPQHLADWLARSGIRHRVLSISACFSGSWLPLLSGPGTLVMTAADADHTSYGCGRGSELTFFGRAMYAEELQRTWSFEAAHAAARLVIDQREKEAGKTDGYSNPQIVVGEGIRETLARLAAQRQAAR